MRIWLFICIFSSHFLFAEKGIVVALNDKYAEVFLPSLAHLRENLKCSLPMEVWHSGDELSEKMKRKITEVSQVVFRDVAKELGIDQGVYRGWQIKPKIMELSHFDEVILMDGDLYFYEDPRLLFDHKGYKETGAFFFRDRTACTYPFFLFGDLEEGDDRFSNESYERRKGFLQRKIGMPSKCVPIAIHHFWSSEEPSKEHPLVSEGQDSGCVVIDKKRHHQGLLNTVELNDNRDETYQFVYGDKETYWIGCEMAHEPYYMNKEVPLGLYIMRKQGDEKAKKYVHIMQFVDGKLFYQQKNPIRISGYGYFIEELTNSKRALTKEEISKIHTAKAIKDGYRSK